MLAMTPALLERMETPHLLAALEAEGPLTPAEKELAKRLSAFEETPEEVEARLEESYERQLEQSYFRAQLIEEILALCEQQGGKKDLVKAIKTALEDSYVEL